MHSVYFYNHLAFNLRSWKHNFRLIVWGKKDHLSSNLLAFTCFQLSACMLTPLQRLNCYFKALADGKSDSLHNTLSTAVKVNVSGLAQASNVLQPLSCKFFPCFFFLFFFFTLFKSLLCIVRRLYRRPRLGRNRHTSSSQSTDLLRLCLFVCALLRNSVSVLSLRSSNGRLLRVTLCLNMFVLLC